MKSQLRSSATAPPMPAAARGVSAVRAVMLMPSACAAFEALPRETSVAVTSVKIELMTALTALSRAIWSRMNVLEALSDATFPAEQQVMSTVETVDRSRDGRPFCDKIVLMDDSRALMALMSYPKVTSCAEGQAPGGGRGQRAYF
jgi:hypothetical protein